eukprot:scaffold804_cov61-Skeletonema_marinoi.AAC.1
MEGTDEFICSIEFEAFEHVFPLPALATRALENRIIYVLRKTRGYPHDERGRRRITFARLDDYVGTNASPYTRVITG